MIPSAKLSAPSLNDCLCRVSWISLHDSGIDRIGLAGDIKKAFLMVSIPEEDRNVISLRFTWVVFGVSPSAFKIKK